METNKDIKGDGHSSDESSADEKEEEEEEEEESMDMGSRPAGQTSLEIGSQDGAGETDEENGWPGPSHPLDRDREGVIETNMDQEEDNNERASPVDNSSIAPSEPLDEAGKLDM